MLFVAEQVRAGAKREAQNRRRDDFYPKGFNIALQFILLKLFLEEKCRIALLLQEWGQ